MGTITEKKIDEFVEEELGKDITQSDKVDKSVEQHLGEMGFLWNRVKERLLEDSICFKCKRDVDFSKEKIKVLEAGKTEKGVIAFLSVCEACSKELENEVESKK